MSNNQTQRRCADVVLRVWAPLLVLMCSVIAIAPAQAQEEEQEERGQQVQSLDPRVARDLLTAFEKLEAGQDQAALADLNRLLQQRGDSMKPFDLASVLQIRGQAYVGVDRLDLALKDFERALNSNALPADASNQLRYNVAQLHFQQENYQEAIRGLVQWMRSVDTPNANAWFLLAAALYYENDYTRARVPAERALQAAETPDRRHHDLANMIYNELNMADQRTRLLQRMITLWPDELSYWKQLAAVHMDKDRSKDALSTLELAYKSNLIDSEADILSMAQLYSVHNNPHRGANLLEKEMRANRVERTVSNLQLLSQLLSQAREHRRAIPVLEEAAKLSDTGALSYRLGQVLLADERNADAEVALSAAIRKGGLNEDELSNAHMLLGTARFNQAGPGDRERRASADEAFAAAERFSGTRAQASGWRNYIKAINDTETRQATLEAEQNEMLAEAARARELTGCRALQIAGRTLTDECVALLEESGGS